MSHNSIMHEFDLIKQCFTNWPQQHNDVAVGIGDDCLLWMGTTPLVVSADTAVSGRHFPEFASPEQVAQRVFLPAISDLAAMGAKPAFFTLALTLPKRFNDDWVIAFAKRLQQLSVQTQCMLAGGDTTQGEQLTITLSVHGTCAHPLLRSGANVGDDVWVTGWLGQAAAALPAVLSRQENTVPNAWRQAYWQPQPPLKFAEQLVGIVHSAMDISDGLAGDAQHLAKASQVDLALNLNSLPLDEPLRALGEEGVRHAVAGGDDYQLLFTADSSVQREILALANTENVNVTKIGSVQAGSGSVKWYDNQQLIDLPWQSFQHF
ncbi:thiamine-phosphate kinase [Reinekea marina]|uniref:Thiamine-monophosphate kinase n=1 Tax=Reinekea marina TaxID=1310421 RepID=A0ABV7WM68_9GAMM|nr:thiamine-phosphate kinase [Reinekea marina]MDN3648396.1 thiamine-phosphate kinase [Reinekea marina]